MTNPIEHWICESEHARIQTRMNRVLNESLRNRFELGACLENEKTRLF